MEDTVLVIGSGAREQCLAWKLAKSNKVKTVYVSPGNGGTENLGCKKIQSHSGVPSVNDKVALGRWCKSENISIVVVGPEVPLADGIVDTLEEFGVACFGPRSAPAQIEASKLFAKEFMLRHSIPTAQYKSFTDAEQACNHICNSPYNALVIKASGLAAGKGVIVAKNTDEACSAAKEILNEKKFGDAGSEVIVEELLDGEEISVLCFTDGTSISVMPSSQDHKKLLNGDLGPNTGGMGAYCPCPQLDEKTLDYIRKNVLQKAVDGLQFEGRQYIGVLYAGLMLTNDGPKVLEFNCRFGDPECQVILPLLKSDLYEVMQACIKGCLASVSLKWMSQRTAVAIVMASAGYPNAYEKGKVITGINGVKQSDETLVFEAGTKMNSDGQLQTSGGRVLSVVAVTDDLQNSASIALNGVNNIKFEGAYFRTDIAHRGINFLKKGCLTYAKSGVNIANGDEFVHQISPIAKATMRDGCAPSLEGFGGVFDLHAAGYNNPILVSGTDGVGTKLKLAQSCNNHSTIGVDLVAMCVNDILTHNAEPLFFLDYYACGKLTPAVAQSVLRGIGEGCVAAGCALIGGETAEMPGMYENNSYDLAGFAVGALEKGRDCPLPCIEQIAPGDVVIGIASSGIHSNGFSLVRKIVELNSLKLNEPAPFNKAKTLGESLLTPTAIYSKQLLPILRGNTGIKGVAHITGGGIVGNLPRILPGTAGVDLNAELWNVQPVFGWIHKEGNVPTDEMTRTFNCGIGMCLVVGANEAENVLSKFNKNLSSINLSASKVGEVTSWTPSSLHDRVVIHNMEKVLSSSYIKESIDQEYGYFKDSNKVSHCTATRNVAVLISGSGTNLQALIDYTKSQKSCSYKIVLVLSNKKNAFGLQRAQDSGINTQVVDHKMFKNRESFDQEVDKILEKANVDFVCLAGFMRLLSGWFVSKWRGRVVNVHPSLLPLFKGSDAHKQVLDSGVRISGCSVHFVVEEMDAGAIIAQESVSVHPCDTVESLQERVKSIEHKTYPQALNLLASGEVKLHATENAVVWAA